MKLYNFVKQIRLDARSKISLKDQLKKEISQAILSKRLPLYQSLPDASFIADTLHLPLEDVEAVYEALVRKKMVKKADGLYNVAYKEFIYDISDNYQGVLEAIKLNGFEPHLKKYPAERISKDQVKSIHPGFANENGLYRLRVDYYGDDLLFAVTEHYLPQRLIEDLDEYMRTHAMLTELFKVHIDHLEQNYTEHAIIYPEWVSNAFDITPGQAGTLIQNEYSNENMLYLFYKGYIINQYTLMMTHRISDMKLKKKDV